MDKIRIVMGNGYQGEGISGGLARGLLVYYGDCHLTGEGMGIGSVALRDDEHTYFSRSWKDSDKEGVLSRTFTLDTCMKWGIGKIQSRLLTRLIESGISAYMRLPLFQGLLMLPVFPLRTLLDIHPLFETVPSRGEVTFTYHVTDNHVEVHTGCNIPAGKKGTLCVLNELSAAWFSSGWDGKQLSSPPPGWEEINPGQLPVSLADPVHGIRFFFGQPSVRSSLPVTVYRGRELNADHCWAGFCIQMSIPEDFQEHIWIRYDIGFTGCVCL